MLSRLLPREESFFEYFERHVATSVEAARLLHEMCAEGTPVDDTARRIKRLEKAADEITHRCVEALHRTFITPIDRNDVHRLITGLDDLTDYIDGAARRLALYEMAPADRPLGSLTAVLVRATLAVQQAVKGLRNMKNASQVLAICSSINAMENEGDGAYSQAMAALFRDEKDAIAVIKWREVFESLENAIDACEDVADIVEGVVIEHG